jgi:hypothetical protein
MKISTQTMDSVKRGAALLDAGPIEKWWQKININTLEMASCTRCILGQLFNDYEDGLYLLKMFQGAEHSSTRLPGIRCVSPDPSFFGFTIYDSKFEVNGNVIAGSWEKLRAAWFEIIAERELQDIIKQQAALADNQLAIR